MAADRRGRDRHRLQPHRGEGRLAAIQHFRWTAEDGKRLRHHLEIEFEQKQNRQIYWDDVAMFCYPQEYQLGIYPMQAGDVIEVDNLRELIALDAGYKIYEEDNLNENEK